MRSCALTVSAGRSAANAAPQPEHRPGRCSTTSSGVSLSTRLWPSCPGLAPPGLDLSRCFLRSLEGGLGGGPGVFSGRCRRRTSSISSSWLRRSSSPRPIPPLNQQKPPASRAWVIAWRVWQRHMDGGRFGFLGETTATPAMPRLYGWSPRGERLVDAAPFGHWKTTTVVAGLRARGIIAPFVLDGPMTGAVFRAYVEQVLAPALEPGDVVAMDNLAVYKVAGVQEAIWAAGASVLYLPSYSPDFNPIEQLFAKLKALLRKAAARTQNALWETIGTLLDDFTPAECQNYIVHSGYEFV